VSRAEEYRRLAQQCLETLRTISNQEARATLVQMAQVWLRLAEEQDAAIPLGAIEQPQSAQPSQPAQQQQQVQPKEDKKE